MQRLLTIPAVGERVALTVGGARRFRSSRELGSYAGLVPSVRQSGEKAVLGSITRAGSAELRRILVQAGHVLLFRCRSADAAALKAIAERVQTARARRKIAVVAAGRHILRIAYYVLRDGTAATVGGATLHRTGRRLGAAGGVHASRLNQAASTQTLASEASRHLCAIPRFAPPASHWSGRWGFGSHETAEPTCTLRHGSIALPGAMPDRSRQSHKN